MTRRQTSDPQRLRTAKDKKMRIGGLHCPVCREPLPSLAGKGARSCASCGGQPVPDQRCAKCNAHDVWEGGSNAGCAACGHHGSRVTVFAGQDWLSAAGRTGRA